MLATTRAKLRKLQLVRSRPLVLVRVVVTLATYRALERHQSAISTCHDLTSLPQIFRKTSLLSNLRDDARAHGAAALADGEAQPFLAGDRRDQLDVDVDVVARHHHLDVLRQLDRARH